MNFLYKKNYNFNKTYFKSWVYLFTISYSKFLYLHLRNNGDLEISFYLISNLSRESRILKKQKLFSI